MKITGKTYDVVKYVTQILLPALGTLYFAIAALWSLPSAQEVVGTIVAVDTFLGVVLHVSSTNYNNSDEKYDGKIHVFPNAGGDGDSMHVSIDPSKIAQDKGEVTLKVISK